MNWLVICLVGFFYHGTAFQKEDCWTKVSYVEKIALLTEWPKSDSKEFIIKTLGEDDFTRSLEQYYSNHKILNKPVTVLKIHTIHECENCQVLYISKVWAKQSGKRIAASMPRKGIMTLGNSPGLGIKGVMINFIDKGNDTRFEINRKAMLNAGFKIGSQLLRAGRPLN